MAQDMDQACLCFMAAPDIPMADVNLGISLRPIQIRGPQPTRRRRRLRQQQQPRVRITISGSGESSSTLGGNKSNMETASPPSSRIMIIHHYNHYNHNHNHHHHQQFPIIWLVKLSIFSLLILLLLLLKPAARSMEIQARELSGTTATSSPILIGGGQTISGSIRNNDSASWPPIRGTIQQSTIGTLVVNASIALTSPAGNGSNSNANASSSSSSSSSLDSSANSNDEGDRQLIIAVISANIVIFIIGFIGNSIVILVILKFTKIETVTDIYILNLAVADLMFITGLIFLITTMFISHWIFGNLMCKLYMATTSLNQFASSLLLVVMSFDRYLAVCHPIYAQRFRRTKGAKIICLCIWIVCLILMAPIFAFAKISKDLTCAIFWPEHFNCEVAFTIYSFLVGFAIPLLLIAGFYLGVIRKLRIAARRGPSALGSGRRSRSRESTNRRIEHLVIGIICTYTICWLPYWMTQLCVSFITNNRQPVAGFYGIVLTASSLSYTNSALNPILYAFLSDNFKRRCSDIIRSIYSFKLFQNCLGFRITSTNNNNNNNNIDNNNNNSNNDTNNNNKSHSYLAPAPTTTGYCETEITRPDPRTNHLYLNESNQQRATPNNNHAQKSSSPTTSVTTINDMRLTIMSSPKTTAAADDPMERATEVGAQQRQLDHGDETNGTGSSTIALCGAHCLGNSHHNHSQQAGTLRRGVNFGCPSAANVIDDNAKNYHKIHHDRAQCQGV